MFKSNLSNNTNKILWIKNITMTNANSLNSYIISLRKYIGRGLYFVCYRLFIGSPPHSTPLAKFIVPDGRDNVNSGIGLSYRHARLHRLAGRYDNLCRSWLSPPVRHCEFGHSSKGRPRTIRSTGIRKSTLDRKGEIRKVWPCILAPEAECWGGGGGGVNAK